MKAEGIRNIFGTVYEDFEGISMDDYCVVMGELTRLESIATRTEQAIREIGHAISSTLEECELHGYTDEQIAYVKGLRWVQGVLEGVE